MTSHILVVYKQIEGVNSATFGCQSYSSYLVARVHSEVARAQESK